MLKGIPSIISPDLLKNLAEMGHGDEIVFADAHFPAHTFNSNVIRADGHSVEALLKAVISLLELDTYATPVIMMSAVEGDIIDVNIEKKYRRALNYNGDIEKMDRYSFYNRAKEAFAVVATGELAAYGNIILKKGIILL